MTLHIYYTHIYYYAKRLLHKTWNNKGLCKAHIDVCFFFFFLNARSALSSPIYLFIGLMYIKQLFLSQPNLERGTSDLRLAIIKWLKDWRGHKKVRTKNKTATFCACKENLFMIMSVGCKATVIWKYLNEYTVLTTECLKGWLHFEWRICYVIAEFVFFHMN